MRIHLIIILLLSAFALQAQNAPRVDRAVRPGPIGTVVGTDPSGVVDYLTPAVQEFTSAKTYSPGEVVKSGGEIWLALGSTNSTPAQGPFWRRIGSRFALVASRGDTLTVFPNARQGDVAVALDTSFLGFRLAEAWTFVNLGTGGAGPSGPVSWNDLVDIPADIADGDDVDDADNDPTNEIQDASEVALDGADYRVAPATTVQEFADKTESALEKARTTTVLTGGVLTTTGATTVNITGGSGQILDNTDPANSKYYAVSWPTQNLSLSSTAQPLTYWYVDSLGTIRQTLTPPVGQDLRTRLYLNASYYTASVGAITGAVSIVTPAQHTPLALAELSAALGALKVSGLAPAAAGTGLQFRVTGGTIFDHGANWPNSEADPHRVVLPQFSTADGGTFRAATATTINPANRTTLDVANYQSGGAVTPIPGNVVQDRYGIHYVFVFPGETANYRTVYGDNFYTSVDEALAALDASKAVSIAPVGFAEFGVLVGAIIAEKDETSNANFTFASTNVFRLFGGGLVSAGASDAVQTVVPGTAILVNSANPANPVVSADTTVLATQARQDAINSAQDMRIDSLAGLNHSGGGDNYAYAVEILVDGFQAGDSLVGVGTEGLIAYLSYKEPTVSLSGPANVYEVGTSQSLSYTATTANPANAALSNGRISRNGSQVQNFGSATTGSYSFTFAPITEETQTLTAQQDFTGYRTGSTNVASRVSRSVYPILYGVSSTNYRPAPQGTGGNPYAALEKLIQVEGNKTGLIMDGFGYAMILIPNTWTDTQLSSIKDPSNVEYITAFTAYQVSVSSAGLTNNYTDIPYTAYILNNTANFSNAPFAIFR